jgi:hypothetical protein
MDCDFCSQNVSPLLSHQCEVVYDRFLREASVPSWGLTLLGLGAHEVIVLVADPDGRKLTKTIPSTADTQTDVRELLLFSHKQWSVTNREPARTGNVGDSMAGKM